MMAKKKRVTRKQLLKEPDEFITFSGKLIQFGIQYKTQITYVAAILVALVVVVSGYRFFSIRSENNAQALLNQAVAKYQSALSSQDSQQAYQTVSEDFQLILNQYGSKNSGKIARVIFAHICYDAGDYAKAIELYRQALEDFKNHAFMNNLIRSDLGYAHEQLNDIPLAVSYFEKIAENQEPILRDEALFNLGVLYEKSGEGQKSADAFKRIITEHPDSMYIEIVKERSAG
jgi:tetratricopeptide (TPR) repeat protein